MSVALLPRPVILTSETNDIAIRITINVIVDNFFLIIIVLVGRVSIPDGHGFQEDVLIFSPDDSAAVFKAYPSLRYG